MGACLARVGRRAQLLCGLLAAGSAAAAPERFELDPEHRFAHFEVLHFGTSTLRWRDGPLAGEVLLDTAAGRGPVALRGVGTALTLQAQRVACAPAAPAEPRRCGGDFEGELLRSSFGASLGVPLVADRVRVLVQVEAVQRP